LHKVEKLIRRWQLGREEEKKEKTTFDESYKQ
jgi:hypothetical protein